MTGTKKISEKMVYCSHSFSSIYKLSVSIGAFFFTLAQTHMDFKLLFACHKDTRRITDVTVEVRSAVAILAHVP